MLASVVRTQYKSARQAILASLAAVQRENDARERLVRAWNNYRQVEQRVRTQPTPTPTPVRRLADTSTTRLESTVRSRP